jgi:glucokinase
VSPSVIGVDLGGTKVAAAPLRDGELGPSEVRRSAKGSGEALLDQIAELVEDLRGESLDGVGIGVPSVVEFKTGRVVSSVNVPLADIPLRQVLGDRLGVPVFVDNDATVAALAEAHDEQLRLTARDLVMLTIGTGVGAGFVLGGRIYRGATGGAGEFGHTIVSLDLRRPVPPPGRFPQPGSLEAAAAGHALDGLAEEAAAAHPDSELARLCERRDGMLGADAVRAALDGDPVAGEIVGLWAQRVGIGVANAINTFDPQEVVIGGGGATAGDLLLEPAVEVARGYVHPGLGGHCLIRLARHGVRAGVLGAALLAVHELEDAAQPDVAPPTVAAEETPTGDAEEHQPPPSRRQRNDRRDRV